MHFDFKLCNIFRLSLLSISFYIMFSTCHCSWILNSSKRKMQTLCDVLHINQRHNVKIKASNVHECTLRNTTSIFKKKSWGRIYLKGFHAITQIQEAERYNIFRSSSYPFSTRRNKLGNAVCEQPITVNEKRVFAKC